MWDPFRRLAERWKKSREMAELEWQERLEISRQNRARKPDKELSRTHAPNGTRIAVLRTNELRQAFVTVEPARQHEKGRDFLIAKFQHCLDLGEIRIEWISESELTLWNRCNEMIIGDRCEKVEEGSGFVTIRVSPEPQCPEGSFDKA